MDDESHLITVYWEGGYWQIREYEYCDTTDEFELSRAKD